MTKTYNQTVFQNQLTEKFSTIYNPNMSVNDLSKSLLDTFAETLNSNAPLKKMTKKEIKNKQKPWITQGLIKSIQVKTKWLKKFMKNKNKNSADYDKYKFYRDKLNHLIKASKKNYYRTYFNEHQNNTKKTWAGINELIGKRNQSLTSNISLTDNNKIITNQKEVANTFNNYFLNVAENLTKEMETPKLSLDYYLDNPNEENFFITPTNPAEVLNLINEMDPKKASDVYDISPKYILDSKVFLADALSKLFNKSVEEHCFPDNLKFAKVLPLHKGKSKMDCKNYRPISLLPLFSKIMERLMYNRLLSFINKHNILYEHQYGFQVGKSTELAINSLLTNTIEAFEGKKKNICIFLDFAKAFDTVNHQILLNKLHYYGIRGHSLKWFESYLSNRKQCVNLGKTNSDIGTITCGVPQGSILGPLLFLLYINDITKCSNILKFFLFADDTCLSYTFDENSNAELTLNEELEKIADWLITNKLSLNVEKSSYLIFSLKKKRDKLALTIKNEILQEKEHTKYLGIIIDRKLNWNEQLNQIKLRLHKGIGILYRVRDCVSKATLRSLYFAFVQSNINYCVLNWGCATPTNLKNIKTGLNKAVRVMRFKDNRYHANNLYKELNILPFEECYKLNLAKLMWKLENEVLPCNIISKYQKQTHKYNTRQTLHNNLQLPGVRLNYSKRFTIYNGSSVWIREVPPQLKNEKNLKIFSKKYKKYLLTNLI